MKEEKARKDYRKISCGRKRVLLYINGHAEE
jgi:hypothetical protein